MTPDPAARSASTTPSSAGPSTRTRSAPGIDYRMIGDPTAARPAASSPLTDEMRRTAAPGRSGSATSASTTSMPRSRRSRRRAAKSMMPRVGSCPASAGSRWSPTRRALPFYLMDPIPPEGARTSARATSSRSTSRSTSAGTSCRAAIRTVAIAFYQQQFGWGQEGDMDMGEMGKYRFIQQTANDDRRDHADHARHAGQHVELLHRRRRHRPRRRGGHSPAAAKSSTGRWKSQAANMPLNAVDPQGAPFGLVGPRKK